MIVSLPSDKNFYLLEACHFFHLLISFANSLDPDQNDRMLTHDSVSEIIFLKKGSLNKYPARKELNDYVLHMLSILCCISLHNICQNFFQEYRQLGDLCTEKERVDIFVRKSR